MPAAVLPPLTTHPAHPVAPAASIRRRPVSVFLPKEHGSWSLALEPLALGLLVAPSPAGGALALAAAAGFFARRPAKLVLKSDADPRRRAAFIALGLFALLGAAGLTLAFVQSGVAILWPLGLALPFAALFAALDAYGEGRSLLAELAGSVAFALLPTACATLAGWSEASALGLGALTLARSAPTVVLVRSCLRVRKTGRVTGTLLGPLAALVALFFLAQLHRAAALPAFALLAPAFLLARAVVLASPLARSFSARRVGIIEVFVGLFYIGLAVCAYRLT